MAYKIILSDAADHDIDEILTYIAEKLANPQAAANLADELEKRYTDLENHPLMYGLSKNVRLAKMGYHRFVVGSYVALYQVDEEQCIVTISRIFYGKREYVRYL